MIHYHGTPIGGPYQDVIRFLSGRHALVPFPRQDHLGAVADVCKSFVFDNGAYSVWRSGKTLDVEGYTDWVREWRLHPGFAWALIPDVIEGSEQENDILIDRWCGDGMKRFGVPVWHLHESLDRLEKLVDGWPIIALGSSGQWATPGAKAWWTRIEDAMQVICDNEGRPKVKLHGLRMLAPDVFTRLPLASADSTNAAVHSGSLSRYGQYLPPNAWQRATVIADRIESQNSAPIWQASTQEALW